MTILSGQLERNNPRERERVRLDRMCERRPASNLLHGGLC